MIEIIKLGLRQRLSTIVWWSLGLSTYVGINMATYPTLRAQAATINEALSHLPSSAKLLLSDSSDFTSPAGFLNSKLLYLILPMLFTILAISLGSSLLAREERSGTLELLLARPLSRTSILLAKAMVGLAVISAVAAIVTAVTVALAYNIDLGIPYLSLMEGLAMTAILGTLFGSLAFMLTALGRRAGRISVGVSAFFALGSYLIVSLIGLVSWFKWPAYLLPYNYYHPNQILNGTYNWLYALGYITVILVLLGIAVAGFQRRDIGS